MTVLLFIIITMLCIWIFDLFFGIIIACIILMAWGGFLPDADERLGAKLPVIEVTGQQEHCINRFGTMEVQKVVDGSGFETHYCVVDGKLELIGVMY